MNSRLPFPLTFCANLQARKAKCRVGPVPFEKFFMRDYVALTCFVSVEQSAMHAGNNLRLAPRDPTRYRRSRQIGKCEDEAVGTDYPLFGLSAVARHGLTFVPCSRVAIALTGYLAVRRFQPLKVDNRIERHFRSRKSAVCTYREIPHRKC